MRHEFRGVRGDVRRLIGRWLTPVSACALLAATAGARDAQEPAPPGGRVAGVVFDSIAGAPLAGVTVHFVGTSGDLAGRLFSARADAAGRYGIDAMPPGEYMVGFYHPVMDTLGFEIGPRLVGIRSGSQTVPLATPSARTLIGRLCPETPGTEGTGLLLGHVRSAGAEMPIDGASVLVEWNEIVMDERGLRSRDARAEGATAGPGWFAICYLPTDVVLHSRAAFGADSSGWLAVEIPPDGLRHVTYHVGAMTRVAPRFSSYPGVADPHAPRLLRGGARLIGTVRDTAGHPVADARVMVWETGLDAVTNENGVFTLENLPSGTHMLEARTIGYVPVNVAVHLDEERPATTELVFRDGAVMMPAITTRAKLVYSSNLRGFERRRRSGFGEFLTPAQIEAMPDMPLSQMLREMQGLELQRQTGGTIATMRSSRNAGTRSCTPSLYLDGRLDRSGDLDLLFSSRIAAVEVYNREFSRPPEFSDRNPCGAIAVWMRPVSEAARAARTPPT